LIFLRCRSRKDQTTGYPFGFNRESRVTRERSRRCYRGRKPQLTRMFHELLSRDREDGRATGQPQGVEPEAYLKGTSQGPTPEDARKDVHIRGRSK
jgi:hypothetical protein